MVLSDWIGKVGADSLFVKRYGVQNIPLMYVLTPIAMLATSAVVFAVMGRVRRRTLLLYFIAGVMLVSVAIQAALPLGGLVLPVAYVFAHGVKETIYLLFWVFAGNLYDSEQSRRLFPLFAGATLVGKILGGVFASALAGVIHAENFIGAQAIGFFLCLLLIVAFRKHLNEASGEDETQHRHQSLAATLQSTMNGYRAVTSDRLMIVFGVGVLLWYLLMQVGSYLYLVGLDASSTLATARQSEDAFGRLYASVYTSSSVLALGLQMFATPFLLRRFGLGGVLFFLPLWYLGSFGAAMVSFNFVTAIAIQLGERIFIPALHRPATEMVYSHVASSIRPRARAFLSGGVNAAGNLAAAAVLSVSTALGLGPGKVLGLAALLSTAFVINALVFRKRLEQRVAENLVSVDGELRRNARQMLEGRASEAPGNVRTDVLRRPISDMQAENP